MIDKDPAKRPSAAVLLSHPTLCPNALKSKVSCFYEKVTAILFLIALSNFPMNLLQEILFGKTFDDWVKNVGLKTFFCY